MNPSAKAVAAANVGAPQLAGLFTQHSQLSAIGAVLLHEALAWLHRLPW
jgi:hypothetical protein